MGRGCGLKFLTKNYNVWLFCVLKSVFNNVKVKLCVCFFCRNVTSLGPMWIRYWTKNIDNVNNVWIFSFNSQDTFGRAKTWVKELQRQASPNIVIALAGNKADLANKRMVEYEVNIVHITEYWSSLNVLDHSVSCKSRSRLSECWIVTEKKPWKRLSFRTIYVT